jgi:hypothetical protein
MVHGTVAIFGESPVAGEISGDGSRGLVFPPDDDARLAELVVGLVGDRERWASMVVAAREYAATMSLEAFQDQLRDMLERQWHVSLPVPERAEPGS